MFTVASSNILNPSIGENTLLPLPINKKLVEDDDEFLDDDL